MLFVTNSKRAAASLVLFTATAIDLHLTHLHRESKAKWSQDNTAALEMKSVTTGEMGKAFSIH